MHTIGRVKRVEASKWDLQPKGFNNTIRWHAGHIFVIVEEFVQNALPLYEPVHSEWFPFFVDDTGPGQWQADDKIPTGEEILAALREQFNWIIPFLEDKLDGKAAKPIIIGDNIMSIDSIEGLAQFLSWHEATHAGFIDALSKY